LIPLEIDITSSIHLPIPEEAEAHPSGFSPPSVEEPPPEMLPVTPEPSSSSSPSWQSFLAEIQSHISIAEVQEKGGSITKELENLRKEFLRKLIANRPTPPPQPPSAPQRDIIDLLIEKLQSFPRIPPESGASELSVPALDLPATHPRIYTETMARLYWSQGDLARAIEIYEVLMQRYPHNTAHYQAQIERIRAGESP
ncbi:MAG: tetratricopeptide repeat protein, partial [Bacteroidia bacterium]|nr:hypothetical protein [Bacteroidia bacterium]MDW8135036.1 tetratricopeptide repeat protein [Bacteroidia bacterium]